MFGWQNCLKNKELDKLLDEWTIIEDDTEFENCLKKRASEKAKAYPI